MAAIAIPALTAAGEALGIAAAMAYVCVASGRANELGRDIVSKLSCHFTPDCYFSENPYLKEARDKAAAEDVVLKLNRLTNRFATTPPSIVDPPGDEPKGGDPMPPPSGDPSWGGMGLAMASVAALYGQLI